MNVFTGPIATGSPNPESCSTKIVCAGNLVADIFINPIAAVPAAGQLALTERLLFGAGGCATNTAACLRRLGSPVKVLGKVGDDVLGNLVIEDLKRLGIDASSVSRSRMHPTSGTVIINVTGEDRRYIHCIGANADFSFSDIDFLALNGAKALYVGGYMAMPRFGPEDLITGVLQGWSLEDILRFASAVGASCTRALGCTDGVFRFDEALTFALENSLPAERWPAKS